MPAPLAVWRLVRAVGVGLHGLATVGWRFPRLDAPARHACIAAWSRAMLRALGLRLVVHGMLPSSGAALIVANHVSWLDVMAIHAVCPRARFVSKADVRGWPVLRRLVDAAGTIYLERERRRDARRVLHEIASALEGGDTVAVFPEGTTGRGPEPLPFHANLLQAAVAAAAPVVPVALRYADAAARFSRAAKFVGDVSLAQSLWRLARGRGLVVHVTVLPAVATAGAERRELAALLRRQIGDAL